MNIADLYAFEAEWPDGSVVNRGASLIGAVRVSLIPYPGSALPRHDLVGRPFRERFMRHFKRTTVGCKDKAALLAAIEAQASPERQAQRAQRRAEGKVPLPPPPKPQKLDEVVQVIIMDDSRCYVRHSDGAVLITPFDYELYL
jgi:hypothetical protein